MSARGRTTRIQARPSQSPAIGITVQMVADRPPVMRPGSADHEQHPSRMGDELRYRDGRVEKVSTR
jgi:hypothetical protein